MIVNHGTAIEGLVCPACGQHDYFNISAKAWVEVTIDGTADGYDYEWDEDSFIVCGDMCCAKDGKVEDFYTEKHICTEECE